MNNNLKIKAWLSAMRLRTLPLALSSIFIGYFVALYNGGGKLLITLLCALTTVLLQILSNLANDYGDSINGADNANRKGPIRMVQAGVISASQMRNSIILFGILSFISGICLLFLVFNQISISFLIFLVIGLACIAAAIKYTAGKNPYGYAGLGDISVFIFFGFVGVIGTYYLNATTFNFSTILPAMAMGCLATGVLNINNLRDIESDKLAGKKSIPVRIGLKNGLIYQTLLVSIALLATTTFLISLPKGFLRLLILIPVIALLAYNLVNVWKLHENHSLMTKNLKLLSIFTLLYAISLGLALSFS